MISQYVTTSDRYHEAGRHGVSRYDAKIPHPVHPNDEATIKIGDDGAWSDWQMVGSAATPDRLFWFWQRSKCIDRDDETPESPTERRIPLASGGYVVVGGETSMTDEEICAHIAKKPASAI